MKTWFFFYFHFFSFLFSFSTILMLSKTICPDIIPVNSCHSVYREHLCFQLEKYSMWKAINFNWMVNQLLHFLTRWMNEYIAKLMFGCGWNSVCVSRNIFVKRKCMCHCWLCMQMLKIFTVKFALGNWSICNFE